MRNLKDFLKKLLVLALFFVFLYYVISEQKKYNIKIIKGYFD